MAYSGPSGSTLLISIADLGNQPKLYKNFLTGGGLRQSPFGNSFGLPFRQASVQASPNYGLLLGQVSPAFPGQASGVVGMAQSSQTIQVPQASPQFSTQASPQFLAQLSAQFSPQSGIQSTATLLSQISQQISPGRGPLVKHVGRLMHPATLLARATKNLRQRFPEAQRAITDR